MLILLSMLVAPLVYIVATKETVAFLTVMNHKAMIIMFSVQPLRNTNHSDLQNVNSMCH